MMTLTDLYRTARSLEAIGNYARADDPLLQETGYLDDRCQSETTVFFDDEFWKPKLVEWNHNAKVENPPDRSFDFFGFALSEWIARVPGLFWTKGAERLRFLGD